MKVKIKRLCEEAVIPRYAHATDAGLDLVATSIDSDEYGNIVYGTGVAIEIPEGYVGLLFPRSSNCKKPLTLANCVGVVDSGYRDEIFLKFRPILFEKTKLNFLERIINFLRGVSCTEIYTYLVPEKYELGDKIGQLIIIPYPKIEFEEADELSASDRGFGGFGSTGR